MASKCRKLPRPYISYSMDQLVAIAKSCGIASEGLDRRQLHAKINTSTPSSIEIYLPRKKQEFSIDQFIKDISKTKTLSGTEKDDILRLKYLLSRHPEDCIMMSEEKDSLGQFRLKSSFTWTCVDGKYFLLVPKLFQPYLTGSCKGKRFIVILLSIVDTCMKINHANIVIIDRQLKTAERFEPDTCLEETEYNFKSLDEQLGLLFPTVGFKYIKPMDYCPVMCYQFTQTLEPESDSEDKMKFCSAWSLFYADLRLTYPDINRSELIDISINSIKQRISLTQFIDNYIEYVLSQGQ